MTCGQFVLTILLYLVCNANGLPRVDPLVETELGLIRGLSSPEGDYSMFLGIPYATVNASNPFGASIPHPGFVSTFDAFDDSAVCPQIEEFSNNKPGTLDCLHLNVYVPSTATSSNRLPVMVWIYGGGFSIGLAGRYIYGPSYLIRHDVILVTLNYRLGPYGFMCLDTPDVPGNQGLKDQLTALRWVNKNIRAFGGDSDKVTIFGESAGGASVDFHYLFRKEKLFNNIIMQSGTSLSSFAITESNENTPLRLAQHLGLITSDINEALAFLTTINSDLVIAAVEDIDIRTGPCVEKEFDNIERFITNHPINVEVGRAAALPILIGFNNNEGLYQYGNKPSEFFETLNVFHDSLTTNFNFENDYLDEMVKVVHQFYMGDNNINENVVWDIIDFASDFTFLHPTYRSIQKYSASGVSSIYSYVFAYNGKRNYLKKHINITEGGAAHADEIGYLFNGSFFDDVPINSEDQLIIDRITTLWTNFAKYSNPIPEETNLLPIQWPAVSSDSLSFLKIDSDLEVLQRPYHDRMAFWDIFNRLNTVYQKGYRENLIVVGNQSVFISPDVSDGKAIGGRALHPESSTTEALAILSLLPEHNNATNIDVMATYLDKMVARQADKQALPPTNPSNIVNGLPKVDPLVETELGLIRGLSSSDGDYSMFLGIPYATVNSSNPFGPSIPLTRFDDTFEALDDTAICPQLNEFTQTITGTLDCLHLNIHVPSTATSSNRLPVMIWIYGGGFFRGFAGSYVYGPKYIVKHDVILVTVNYRLGPYGFMCHNTPDVPGNQGLKDQLTALRWVKNNIRAFGGDSDKITLFGESAGGVSVDFHYLYTQEKLFNNIIIQSGTQFSPFAIAESEDDVTLRLAEYLGYKTSALNEALSFLGTVDTDLVIAALQELDYRFLPCVEKEFDNTESFITDYPVNVISRNAATIPILIGFNDDERHDRYVNQPSEFFDNLNVIYNLLDTNFNFDKDYLEEMVKIVKQYYIGDGNISEAVMWDIIKFDSDFTFMYPTYRAIQKYSANDIYHYVFSYNGQRNFIKKQQNITVGGAAHADELSYLFDVSFFDEVPTPEDQLIIDRITTLWTNFAKYSNPTPEETELLPVQWPAVTGEILSFLKIDLDLEVHQRLFHDRMAFWDLFYRLNEAYQKGYRDN